MTPFQLPPMTDILSNSILNQRKSLARARGFAHSIFTKKESLKDLWERFIVVALDGGKTVIVTEFLQMHGHLHFNEKLREWLSLK